MKKIYIKKIFKDFDCCPIRWRAILEDDSIITIRERGHNCVVYKTDKSVFSVTDEDVIINFVTEFTGEDVVLQEALLKMHAKVDSDAMNYLHENYDEYLKNLQIVIDCPVVYETDISDKRKDDLALSASPESDLILIYAGLEMT